MNTLLFSALLYAKDPKEILEEAIQKQQLENSIQTVQMTLVSKSGSKQIRVFSMMIRRDDDALRSYTRFEKPNEIRGTQLVFVDRPNKKDPQLMYLPALGRVQRIAGNAQKGALWVVISPMQT